jgi:hypothetical protein
MILASPVASQVVPGVLGFLVVAGMGVVLFFLFRSMVKHLRKVTPDPGWRKEASQADQASPGADYSHNGTAQP